MALQLTEKCKGLDANYWKIIYHANDHLAENTEVKIALYLDREAREENTENYLKTETIFLKGLDLTREDIYIKLKEDVVEKDEITGEEIHANKFYQAITC